jgi:hypothetical protein
VRVKEVVAPVRRVEAVTATNLKPLLLNDELEHRLGVVEELLRLGPDGLVVEDLRVPAVRVTAAEPIIR